MFLSKLVEILVWERMDQNENKFTKWVRIDQNEDELTKETFYEFEMTEKRVRVDQNESELTEVRIELRTNWLCTNKWHC